MNNRETALITVVLVITAAILLSENHGVFAAGWRDIGNFDRSFTVGGPVDLSIENSSGSVSVRRGDTSKVEIHAMVRAGNFFGNAEEQAKKILQNPPVQQNGNSIRITRPEPRDWFNHVSISYDIVVPEETTITSSTGSGSQTISSVKGPVTIKSGSGSLDISNVASGTEAQTGSGSIKLYSVDGTVRAQTGSGSVRADGVGGAFRVRTGSGGIDAELSSAGDVDAQTGSGHIRIENVNGGLTAHAGSGSIHIDGHPTNTWTVHSGSGSIDLRVTGDSGLDLYAHTGSGRVSVDSPITLEAGELNKHEVRGKIRGGGTRLEATTGSGSIHIQ